MTVESTARLPSGRRLAFAEFGDLDGRPVFFFHGTPGNRQAAYLEEWGNAFNIHFFVPERPGFGRSSFQRDRRLLDWPRDVDAMLNHLGLSRVTVFGVSGGGPYALACAYAIPDRLESAICVSGVGPPDA